MKEIKVTMWLYMRNGGDGSASAKFFPTEQKAEQAAEEDDERFCDDIYPVTIVLGVYPDGKVEFLREASWEEC